MRSLHGVIRLDLSSIVLRLVAWLALRMAGTNLSKQYVDNYKLSGIETKILTLGQSAQLRSPFVRIFSLAQP